MTEAESPEFIEIVVELPAAGAALLNDPARLTLARTLTALLEDLGAPKRPSVSLVARTEGHGARGVAMRLTIAGVSCRIDRQRSPVWRIDELTSVVCDAVFKNRLHLFTDDFLTGAFEATHATIPRESRIGALSEAMQLGLPLRAAGMILDYFGADQADECWIEDGIAAVIDNGIRIRASLDQMDYFCPASDGGSKEPPLGEMLQLARSGIFYELGVIFGNVDVIPDGLLPEHSYQIEVNGVRRPVITGVRSDQVQVNDTEERLNRLLGLDATLARNPANLSLCATVSRDARPVCQEAGLTAWDPREHMVLALAGFVRRNAPLFLTVTQVDRALGVLSESQPRLVEAALALFPTARLCRILRGLLAEAVSIRDLGVILESLIDLYAQGRELRIEDGIAHVRERLSPQICQANGKDNKIICCIFDEAVEARLAGIGDRKLQANEEEKLVEAIARGVTGDVPWQQNTVLLVGSAIRRYVRDLIALELPSVRVLGYQELVRCPDWTIEPVEVVRFD